MNQRLAQGAARRKRRAPASGRVPRWALSAAAGVTITAGVGLGLGAPAALAAESCGNAALRAQQGAEHLPDCRAYEQVSPVDKNGGTIASGLGARREAGAVTFWSTSSFADTPGSIMGNYRAMREDDGWTTRSLNPPTTGRNPILMDQFYVSAMSDDFSRAVIETKYPVDPDDQGTGAAANIGHFDDYRFEGDGSFTWLSKPTLLPDVSPKETYFVAASGDLERIAFASTKPLTDDGGPALTTQQVYVRDGDTTRLVSIAPGGGALPGGATLGGNDWSNAGGSTMGGVYPSALSADGQTVYFMTYKNLTNPQIYVRTNALGAGAASKQASRSHAADTAGAGCQINIAYLAANRDGSRMWFGCPTKLTDDAPATGGVYVYDRDADDLEYVASPVAPTGISAGQAKPIAADPDADYLWFQMPAALTDDAPAGGNNVYVLHNGRFSLVANVGSDTVFSHRVALSPDGTRIAFDSTAQVSPRAGGFSQVYAADANAADTTAVCVSCRRDGSTSQGLSDFRNAGLAPFVGPSRVPPFGAIDDDGRVFFTSVDRLVPEDTNDTADVYQYRGGELTLISTGTDPGGAVFAGASADGTDVFLITAERLVPQDTDNGVADIYTARIDGGFAVPETEPSCGTDCQGPEPESFVPPGNASSGGGGSGNVVPAPVPTPAPKPGVTAAKVSAKQRTAWAKRGRVALSVKATGAGTVRATVDGRLGKRNVRVASASRKLAKSGSAKLTLRLSKRARAYLKRHHKLRLTITVRHSEARAPKRTTLTLRAAATKRTNGGAR
jgi:hypothetical protein